MGIETCASKQTQRRTGDAVGFEHLWVRTDYLFRDKTEADTLTRFFFGDDMVAKIRQDEHGVVLPECTGIWWVKRAP